MNYKVIYHPLLHQDIQEVVDWYNGKKDYLGNTFYHFTQEQIDIITKNPFLFQIRYKDIRCVKIKKFPYLIHYSIDDKNEAIVIKAVFSTFRNPKIW